MIVKKWRQIRDLPDKNILSFNMQSLKREIQGNFSQRLLKQLNCRPINNHFDVEQYKDQKIIKISTSNQKRCWSMDKQ